MTGTLSYLHHIYKVEKVQKTRKDYSFVSCKGNASFENFKLPEIVRLEKNQGCSKAKVQFEEYLIVKDSPKWKDASRITGLFPSHLPNAFYGDKDEKKHFVVFMLSPSRENLHIVLFPNYYPVANTEREQVIISVIEKGNI